MKRKASSERLVAAAHIGSAIVHAERLNEWTRLIAETFDFDPGRVTPTASTEADLPARSPNVRLADGPVGLDIEMMGVAGGHCRMEGEDAGGDPYGAE